MEIFVSFLSELAVQGVEAVEACGAEAFHLCAYLFQGFLFCETAGRLGEELVGVAYEAFHGGAGRKVAGRERQVLVSDFLCGESGTGMALTDIGAKLEAQGTEHGCPRHAVGQVRESAVAVDGGCVGADYADVVEEGGEFRRAGVYACHIPFFEAVQDLVCHRA